MNSFFKTACADTWVPWCPVGLWVAGSCFMGRPMKCAARKGGSKKRPHGKGLAVRVLLFLLLSTNHLVTGCQAGSDCAATIPEIPNATTVIDSLIRNKGGSKSPIAGNSRLPVFQHRACRCCYAQRCACMHALPTSRFLTLFFRTSP